MGAVTFLAQSCCGSSHQLTDPDIKAKVSPQSLSRAERTSILEAARAIGMIAHSTGGLLARIQGGEALLRSCRAAEALGKSILSQATVLMSPAFCVAAEAPVDAPMAAEAPKKKRRSRKKKPVHEDANLVAVHPLSSTGASEGTLALGDGPRTRELLVNSS